MSNSVLKVRQIAQESIAQVGVNADALQKAIADQLPQFKDTKISFRSVMVAIPQAQNSAARVDIWKTESFQW